MSNVHLDIHDVVHIVTQRRRLNGRWQRRLVATCEDGSTLTLVLYTRGAEEALLLEKPEEYINVEEYTPAVEYSDTPFDPPPSAEERQP